MIKELKESLKENFEGYLISLGIAFLASNLILQILGERSLNWSLILIPFCAIILFLEEILILSLIIGGKDERN